MLYITSGSFSTFLDSLHERLFHYSHLFKFCYQSKYSSPNNYDLSYYTWISKRSTCKVAGSRTRSLDLIFYLVLPGRFVRMLVVSSKCYRDTFAREVLQSTSFHFQIDIRIFVSFLFFHVI